VGWVRVDDQFADHPKLANIGPLGWGLWLAGVAYCNRHLTDGYIPRSVAVRLACPEVVHPSGQVWRLMRQTDDGETAPVDMAWVIDLLVAAGLWHPVPGGYQVHDYLDYQPSAAEVHAARDTIRRRAMLNARPEVAKAVKERDGNRCRYCGRAVSWRDRRSDAGATYDHVVPVAAGGAEYDPDNIVVCCRACATRKANQTLDEAGMTLLPPPSDTVDAGGEVSESVIYQVSIRNLSGNNTESIQNQTGNNPESITPKPKPKPKKEINSLVDSTNVESRRPGAASGDESSPKPTHPAHELIRHFSLEYERIMGEPYAPNWGRDTRIIKDLLKFRDPERLRRTMTVFLAAKRDPQTAPWRVRNATPDIPGWRGCLAALDELVASRAQFGGDFDHIPVDETTGQGSRVVDIRSVLDGGRR